MSKAQTTVLITSGLLGGNTPLYVNGQHLATVKHGVPTPLSNDALEALRNSTTAFTIVSASDDARTAGEEGPGGSASPVIPPEQTTEPAKEAEPLKGGDETDNGPKEPIGGNPGAAVIEKPETPAIDIESILNQPVKTILAGIDGYSIDHLTSLVGAELARETPRTSLINKLDHQRVKLDAE